MRPKTAIEVQLPDGRSVVVAELGLGDVKRAMQLAGSETNEQARSLETAVQGLRLSVRKINDRDVTYDDLMGARWEDHFSMRETMALASVWNSIHMPDAPELAALRGNAKTIAL